MNKPAFLKKYSASPYSFALYYFIYFCSNVIYTSYLSLYFASLEYTDSQIGILLALPAIITMFVPFFWGKRTDRAGNKTRVLAALLTCCCLIAPMFYITDDIVFVGAVTCLFAVFYATLSSLGDSLTIEYGAPRGFSYGKIRLCGSMGYVVMGMAMGALITRFTGRAVFVILTIMLAASALLASQLPAIPGSGKKPGAKENRRLLSELMRHKDIVLLFILSFFMYGSMGFYSGFFSLYFTNELGASTQLFGVNTAVVSAAEVVFLALSDRIFRHINMRTALLAGFVLSCVRWLGCAVITNPYLLIGVNALQGFSHMVFAYCSVIYIDQVVAPGCKTVFQSVRGIITTGISKVVTSVAGGYIYELLGGRSAFMVNFIFIMLGGIFIVWFGIKYRLRLKD